MTLMEIFYRHVNLMYFMLCSEHWRIKGSRSNKRRKLLTCFINSLFKVYNNLSLRETRPEVYNTLTSIEYRLKILYLTLLSIMVVDHLLWDYVDYDLCREQYSVTHVNKPVCCPINTRFRQAC